MHSRKVYVIVYVIVIVHVKIASLSHISDNTKLVPK